MITTNARNTDDLISSLRKVLKIDEMPNREALIDHQDLPLEIHFHANVSKDVRENFKALSGSPDDKSVPVKKEGDRLKVDIEQSDVKVLDWINNNILKQEFDIKILILNQEAYIHSRDNRIKQIKIETIAQFVQYCLQFFDICRKKIWMRSKKVIAFRDNTKKINGYYDKFFNVSVSRDVDVSVHLIKTFDAHQFTLKKNTYISAKLYQHKHAQHVPTIIFFPGTAYTRMLGETIDKEACKLAADTGCHVFSVHYRLSPENVFPAPLLDAIAAYEYLRKIALQFHLREEFILSGYSSGATLALQFGYLLSLNRDVPKPSSMILVCPAVDFSYLLPEYKGLMQNTDRFITVDFARSMHGPYFSQCKDYTNPMISPLYMDEKSASALPSMCVFLNVKDIYYHQQMNFCRKFNLNSANGGCVQFAELDHCSWWDNQMQWECMSDWIRKKYHLKNSSVTRHTPLMNLKATTSLPFSTQVSDEKNAIDVVYNQVLHRIDTLESVLAKADQYPHCIGLQIYACTVLLLSQNQCEIRLKIKYLNRLVDLKSYACQREKLLINALLFAKKGHVHLAIENYIEVLMLWPDDLLAGVMIEFYCVGSGDIKTLLTAWQTIKDHHCKDHRVNHAVLGSIFLTRLGNAFDLSGCPEKSILYAGIAFSINPVDPFSQYVVAHACAQTGDVANAITLLEKYCSNYFYLAMLYLKNNNAMKAYEIFERYLKKNSLETIEAQVDIITLLWRLDLSDNLPAALKKKVESELHQLYFFICHHAKESVRSVLLQHHLFPYVSLCYLYLCARVGNVKQARDIKDSMMDGRELADGILSFVVHRYNDASQKLSKCYRNPWIGGTAEHRSVYVECYHAANKRNIHRCNKAGFFSVDRKQHSKDQDTQFAKYSAFILFSVGLAYVLYNQRILSTDVSSCRV